MPKYNPIPEGSTRPNYTRRSKTNRPRGSVQQAAADWGISLSAAWKRLEREAGRVKPRKSRAKIKAEGDE